MFIYEKNKKLYGTNTVPSSTDAEIEYRDADNNVITLNETDSYVDDKHGGIIRKSDNKQLSMVFDNQYVVPYGGGEAPVACKCLCFTANTAGSTIEFYTTGRPTFDRNFQTSVDGETWTTFDPDQDTITLTNVGDKVYFKGNNPDGVSENAAEYTFYIVGSVSSSGNIMSLIDDGACTCTTIPNAYCFNQMFSGCSSLTTAPALPATNLASDCYNSMFSGCTSLIVSDSSESGYDKEWTIPASGTFTRTSTQSFMFLGCNTGTGLSSFDLKASVGASKTYYTQNTHV